MLFGMLLAHVEVSPSMTESLISYDDFEKVKMRVGRIIKVEDFPKARKPAYKLWIDFGEWGRSRRSPWCWRLLDFTTTYGALCGSTYWTS